MNRESLWKILSKIGCPAKFVSIIQSFHEGMSARVQENGDISEPFSVTNGTKQGCVLAPLLFNIFFAAMMQVAFSNCDIGVPIQFRTDGDIFNIRRLQAKRKTLRDTIRDLLYADDCELVSHSVQDAQMLMNRFSEASKRFGLTISHNHQKTEVMHQSFP